MFCLYCIESHPTRKAPTGNPTAWRSLWILNLLYQLKLDFIVAKKTSFACKKTDGTLAGHVFASAWYDDVMLWCYDDMIIWWYGIIYKYTGSFGRQHTWCRWVPNSMSEGIQGVQTKHTFCTGKLHLLKEQHVLPLSCRNAADVKHWLRCLNQDFLE